MEHRTKLTIGVVVALGMIPVVWRLTGGSTSPPPGVTWARRIEIAGVGNFAEVAPGLYRGDQPTAEGYASLKTLGVKTVINLRLGFAEKDAVTAAGLDYLEIPLKADLGGSRPPSHDEITRFLTCVLDVTKRPVFFHCAHGEDRTGTMCAIYRIEVCHWSPRVALAEMRSFGFNRVWDALEDFIEGYEPKGEWDYLRRSEPSAVGSGS
jgi:protein tyrosine/serine phosphatase